MISSDETTVCVVEVSKKCQSFEWGDGNDFQSTKREEATENEKN